MKTIDLEKGFKMTLRQAVPEDAERLLAFTKIVGGETDFLLMDENGISMPVEKERELLADYAAREDAAFFLAEIDGEIVGTASIEAARNRHLSHNARFGIAVRKKFWHIGIGSALLETMLAFARESGKIEYIRIEVRAGNERALKLYEHFGFRQVGLRERAIRVREDEYYDEILMDLKL